MTTQSIAVPITDANRVRDALDFIDPNCDRDNWVQVGMAIHDALGPTGDNVWHEWSSKASSYNERDARDVWKSIKPGGIKAGTLFKQARDNGYCDPKPLPRSTRSKDVAITANTPATDLEQQKHAKAATIAARTLTLASPAQADHPYLVRKGVKPAPTLYQLPIKSLVEALGYHPQAKGVKLEGDVLIAPIVDMQGKVQSLEFIDETGHKSALRGGAKSSNFWVSDNLQTPTIIAIGEGIATAITATMVLENCLAVASLANTNLTKTALALRSIYPNAKILILADLSKVTGEPDTFAQQAATATHSALVVPDFDPDRDQGQTDLNDLMLAQGMEAVQARILDARRVLNTPQEFDDEPTSATEFYQRYQQEIFTWQDWTYRGRTKVVKKKDGPEVEYTVWPLLDCSIRLVHSLENGDDADDRPCLEHVFELYSVREGTTRVLVPADAMANLGGFAIAMHQRRQVFYGNNQDLCCLAHHLFSIKPTPPKIRALSTVGYDEQTQGFYFPKFAYNAQGQRLDLNGDKFFTEARVKPFAAFADAVINRLQPINLIEFADALILAYDYRGLMALGFWVASTFSHTIFEHYGFFPFLSLYGDPHSGKSYLTRLLNRCFFVDSEGHTMTKANTSKGELRKISQRSSMVCCLLEGRKDKSTFDYDSILPLYNRNALYSRATTSQDNRTHDLRLQAAICFVWNHENFTLKPAKERVISILFRESDLNAGTTEAWRSLNAYAPEQLAGVGHAILGNRNWYKSRIVEACKLYADRLKARGVVVARVAENHAIALAGAALFLEHIGGPGLTDELVDYAVQCARTKLETAKTDAHLADYFFECINNLAHNAGVLTKNGELQVRLPTVITYLQQNHAQSFDKSKLIEELRSHDRFITVKSTRAFDGIPHDAYVFKEQVSKPEE